MTERCPTCGSTRKDYINVDCYYKETPSGIVPRNCDPWHDPVLWMVAGEREAASPTTPPEPFTWQEVLEIVATIGAIFANGGDQSAVASYLWRQLRKRTTPPVKADTLMSVFCDGNAAIAAELFKAFKVFDKITVWDCFKRIADYVNKHQPDVEELVKAARQFCQIHNNAKSVGYFESLKALKAALKKYEEGR